MVWFLLSLLVRLFYVQEPILVSEESPRGLLLLSRAVWRRTGLEWRKHFLILLRNAWLVSTTADPLTRAGELWTCQSIKEFHRIPNQKGRDGCGPKTEGDLWLHYSGFGIECQVGSGERTAGRGSLIWPRVIPTLHIALLETIEVPHRAAVCTHRGMCLSSARIWSLGFSPNLSGENKRGKVFQEAWRGVWSIAGTKGALWTYLSRKSLSTTAEMSSRGFPIPKSAFSLCGGRKQIVSLGLPLIESAQLSLTRLWSDGSSQCRFDLPAIVLGADNG